MFEQDYIEKAIEGAPEGLYAVKVERFGCTAYAFGSIDEDGGWWSLGDASEVSDPEGGWRGHLDTRSVCFNDEDELQAEFRRILREEAVIL